MGNWKRLTAIAVFIGSLAPSAQAIEDNLAVAETRYSLARKALVTEVLRVLQEPRPSASGTGKLVDGVWQVDVDAAKQYAVLKGEHYRRRRLAIRIAAQWRLEEAAEVLVSLIAWERVEGTGQRGLSAGVALGEIGRPALAPVAAALKTAKNDEFRLLLLATCVKIEGLEAVRRRFLDEPQAGQWPPSVVDLLRTRERSVIATLAVIEEPPAPGQ